MSETDIVNKIMKHINEDGIQRGSFCYKHHGSALMPAGIPDILGFWRFKPIALEVKKPSKRHTVTLLQQSWLSRYKICGALAGVVTSWDDCLELFAS